MSVYEYKEKPHRLEKWKVRELEYLVECYNKGTRSEKEVWKRFLEIIRGDKSKD